MIAGCLLTAILIVMPPIPGMEVYFPGQWLFAQESLAGLCNTLLPKGRMFVEDRKLIIMYVGERYEIPFPPQIGRWEFSYWIGDDTCDLGVWGMVQVRRGPRLMI